MTTRSRRLTVASLLIVAYFMMFPGDLAPIERILALTEKVSPWLYAALGIAPLGWAALQAARAYARSRAVDAPSPRT